MQLLAGSLIADRFAIEGVAGSGGMGTVYRALDRASGQQVALKILHRQGAESRSPERFLREAELLAQLSHPNIVSYVAHGETADGLRYLAMEWLTGEALAQRLTTGRLTVRESLTCVTAVAAALAAIHSRGIIHRDIKPSNLLLRHGELARTTLLDFGIAQRGLPEQQSQPAEAAIGTPLYMAPEQARGEQDVGPGADIFSLGCVLYECLTGRPPFQAAHPVAVLARILCEEALPVRALRPELPAALEALLARMLAKAPGQRPPDGGALRTELAALGELGSAQEPTGPYVLAGRWPSGTEQQLVCVMVAGSSEHERGAGVDPERRRALDALVRSFAGQPEWLLDGSLVITMAGLKLHSAIDLAYQAAQCARALTREGGLRKLTLATCRAVGGAHVPLGGVIDQAVALLAKPPPGPDAGGQILLDRLSAVLLARHFVVHSAPGLATLGPELKGAGQPGGGKGPLVGRESELAALTAFWNSTVEESEPALVVLTGPSGAGKTRLCQELVGRLQASGEALTVLTGCGEPARASLPYGLLEQALRGLAEDPAALLLAIGQAQQGRPTEHEPLQRQLVQALRQAAGQGPVLLVLEAVQWADPLSIATLGRALKQLAGSPLLVLVTGPARLSAASLWPEHPAHQIVLKGLSKRACERLIRQQPGVQLAPDAVTRLVELSGGNPLFLEVLMQLLASGAQERESETVTAMLQARFSGLPAAARRTLLAASLFGPSFCRSELALILGEDEEGELDSALRTLEEAELIDRRGHGQLGEPAEYGFRHPLISTAASELLSEHDRRVGERFVAELRGGAPTPAAPSPSSTAPSSAHRS